MWKWIRVCLLLVILASVASAAWLNEYRISSWKESATIAIYPIIGDTSSRTSQYVKGLTAGDYTDIEQFFSDEAQRYHLSLPHPVQVRVYTGVSDVPPAPPLDERTLDVILWSLSLRYYAWQNSHQGDGLIRVFVIFHDPKIMPAVPHSLGLKPGLIGVVHAFATPQMAGSNNVVISHEILHALGASDRYDLRTNLPLQPQGLGNPQQVPVYPQEYAEIMAGRRMLGPRAAETPLSLSQCLIGTRTAQEIHWLR